ncbi:hypothetical protein LJR235_004934 [Pararhizobium sp. LjRoot235]
MQLELAAPKIIAAEGVKSELLQPSSKYRRACSATAASKSFPRIDLALS